MDAHPNIAAECGLGYIAAAAATEHGRRFARR